MPKNTVVKNAHTPEGPVRLEEVWVDDYEPTALQIPFDLETRDVLLGLAHRWAEMSLAHAHSMFKHGLARDVPMLDAFDRRLAEIAELVGSDVVQHVVDHAAAQFGSEPASDLAGFWGC